MSDLFPAAVLCQASGNYVDVVASDVIRATSDERLSSSGLWSSVPAIAMGTSDMNLQQPFLNGSVIDLTANGATTPQIYQVAPSSGTWLVGGLGIEMITSANLVFNGKAFGGQYTSGSATVNPTALPNGLLLAGSFAGTSVSLANLQINEDFMIAQEPVSGGSVSGVARVLKNRFELQQTLSAATNDYLSWTVRDNIATNHGIVELRAYVWGQITS